MTDPRDDAEPPIDPLILLQQQLDQQLAMAPELARALRSMFDAFEAEGFSASQALYLVAVQLKDHPFPAP